MLDVGRHATCRVARAHWLVLIIRGSVRYRQSEFRAVRIANLNIKPCEADVNNGDAGRRDARVCVRACVYGTLHTFLPHADICIIVFRPFFRVYPRPPSSFGRRFAARPRITKTAGRLFPRFIAELSERE